MAKRNSKRSSNPGKGRQTGNAVENDKRNSYRPVWLALIGLVCAGAIITLVVFLTPMEDDIQSDQLSIEQREVHESVASNTSQAAAVVLPRVPPAIDLEQTHTQLKKLAKAMQNRYPQDPAAYHYSAQIYAGLKQSQQAEELWQKCIDLKPGFVGPYIGLARIFTDSGRGQAALDLLEHTRQVVGTSAELRLSLGDAQENLGMLTDAKLTLESLVKDFPHIGSAWLSLGRVQNQLGQFRESEANLRKAIEIDGPSEPALFALTTSLMRQQKMAEAQEVRTQLTDLREKTSEVSSTFEQQYDDSLRRIASSMLVAAAALEEQHSAFDAAADYCLQAIAIDPLYLQSYMSLSAVYRRLGRLTDALAVQQRLLELQPEVLLNYLNLASVSLQAGDATFAEDVLRQAIVRDSAGVIAQTALTRLYLATGRVQEAHALAEQIVQRQETVEALQLLAATLAATGHNEQAHSVAKRAEQLSLTEGAQPE